MRILFLGDIVGQPGVSMIKRALPAVIAHEHLDLVIANAENVTGGSGLTPRAYRDLRHAGIDLVTMGDHVYKRLEILPTLEKDERICRPANFPASAPGRELVVAPAREGTPVAALCVLGEAARQAIFGGADPIDRFVKIGAQWFRVIGVAGPQATVRGEVGGLPAQDRNNLIYVPTAAAILRLEDTYSAFRDEIDGVLIRLRNDSDITASASIVRSILESSHRGASDYSVIVPTELLAEQQRTKRIFDVVMVALASISLLVGGIGIMNIMLANVLERTSEIGLACPISLSMAASFSAASPLRRPSAPESS